MNQLIDRLGINAWASNLAVNLIENGQMKNGYRYECDDYSILINEIGSKYSVFVRAYVPGYGWQTSEIVYSL
jgi:hypothetical protein